MIDIHNKIFLGNCFGNPIIEAVGKKWYTNKDIDNSVNFYFLQVKYSPFLFSSFFELYIFLN